MSVIAHREGYRELLAAEPSEKRRLTDERARRLRPEGLAYGRVGAVA